MDDLLRVSRGVIQFEACPGGSKTDFNEGTNLIVSRGENRHSLWCPAGCMGRSFKNLKGGTNLHAIKYLGGVMFLITSWGDNDLINDCPRGDDYVTIYYVQGLNFPC